MSGEFQDPVVARVVHLLMGDHFIELPAGDGNWTVRLGEAMRQASVSVGDVMLIGVHSGLTRSALLSLIAGQDRVLHRTEQVWDIYESDFGATLLRGCDSSLTPHHTQIRIFSIGGHEVSQVAVYPKPVSVAGTRMWCDPALIVIFVEDGGLDLALTYLKKLQPLWERLRAHHGLPLLANPQRALTEAYPVPNQAAPLTPQGWSSLREAVLRLQRDDVIEDVFVAEGSPQDALRAILLARQEVQKHVSRISTELYHSHGPIEHKCQAISERAEALLFASGDDSSAAHLVAPHGHLMSGLIETRMNVQALATGASETAALLSTATVGRLLDRSEANRTAATIVGAALAVTAFVSIFAALAAVPTTLSQGYLVRLGSWIGFGAIMVALVILAMVKLADQSVNAISLLARRWLQLLSSAALAVALALFLGAAVRESLNLLIIAGIATIVAMAGYARLNNFR